MELFLEQLQEIDNMYIIKVTRGHFVSTGSCIVYDIDGNEYFANSSIVEKNQNKFDSLKEKKSSFWVLLEKQKWGTKWENKEVVSIRTISETKEDCQNVKSNLLYKMILRWNLNNLHQSEHNAININNDNNEITYSSGIKILERLLADLNTKIDIY